MSFCICNAQKKVALQTDAFRTSQLHHTLVRQLLKLLHCVSTLRWLRKTGLHYPRLHPKGASAGAMPKGITRIAGVKGSRSVDVFFALSG